MNSPIKNSKTIIHRTWKVLWIFSFKWKHKNTGRAKLLLNDKWIAGGITILDLRLYYRAIALNTAWYWHKSRHFDQWNRITDPYISLYTSMDIRFLIKKSFLFSHGKVMRRCPFLWEGPWEELNPYPDTILIHRLVRTPPTVQEVPSRLTDYPQV